MKKKIIHWSLAMTLAVTALPAAALAQSGAAAVTAEAAPVESPGYKQARLAAEAILKSKYPFAVAEAVHTPHPNPEQKLESGKVHYSVHFVRHLKGIPYPENQINMVIDEKGLVISERIIWHKKAVLSDQKMSITAESAAKHYMEKAQVFFHPLTPSMFHPSKVNFLSARLNDQLKLDAVNGKLEEGYSMQADDNQGSGELVSGTPLPGAAAKTINTAEEALEQARKFTEIPTHLTMREPELFEYRPDSGKWDPGWSIDWHEKNDWEGNGELLNIFIRQSTGELVTLGTRSVKPHNLKEFSVDDARKMARATIIKFVPQLAHQLTESDAYTSADSYVFFYKPAVDSGGVGGGHIRIIIMRTSATLGAYENRLSDTPPLPKPGRSESELKAALLPAYKFRLTGVTVPPSAEVEDSWERQLVSSGYKELITNTPVEVKLVYSPELKDAYRELFLDASDGVWKYLIDGATVGEKNRPTSYRP